MKSVLSTLSLPATQGLFSEAVSVISVLCILPEIVYVFAVCVCVQSYLHSIHMYVYVYSTYIKTSVYYIKIHRILIDPFYVPDTILDVCDVSMNQKNPYSHVAIVITTSITNTLYNVSR